jgi:hypothetical protein
VTSEQKYARIAKYKQIDNPSLNPAAQAARERSLKTEEARFTAKDAKGAKNQGLAADFTFE